MIVKPRVDEREYKLFVLKNGMKVVTISHPESEVSAAALRVEAGNFQNPDEITGLAHFVEHMLFMGTEKYPDVKDFNTFVTNNGGGRNGYTTNDSTCYFFEIEKSYFEPCLDRFSRFFACPLLKKEGVQGELNVVHSEFQKNLTSDFWRLFQTLKTLASPSKHVFTRFTTGNRDTLDRPDIHDRVKEFFNEHYSSNLMYLVIYGTEKSEDLKALAEKYFEDVKNNELPPRYIPGTIYYPPNFKHKIHHLIPVRESRAVKLYFPIPYEHKNYRTSQVGIMSHLIGHESEGSLFYHLKHKGWLSSLSAGRWFKWNGLLLFGCEMEMSVEGESHVDEIILSFFEYVSFARKLPLSELQRIFEEKKKISEANFQYKDNARPSRICPYLTSSMSIGRPEDILLVGSNCLYDNFDEEKYRDEISYLRLDNMICFWSSTTHSKLLDDSDDDSLFETEPIYGAKYRTLDLSPKLIESIMKTEDENQNLVAPPKHFSSPVDNIFIPTSLEVLGFSNEQEKEKNHYPRLIYETERMKVFFKQDTLFSTRPKSVFRFRLFFPAAVANVHNRLCQNIITRLIRDKLNKILYYADLVSLEMDVISQRDGITVRCAGWNSSLPKLMELILNYVTHFTPSFDEKRFIVIKDEVMRKFKNMRVDTIVYSGLYLAQLAVTGLGMHHYEEYISAGNELTLEDVKLYYQKHMVGEESKCRIEILAMGNETEESVLNGVVKSYIEGNEVLKTLPPYLEKDIILPKIVKLKSNPQGVFEPFILAQPTTNPLDRNNGLVYNVQIGLRNEREDILSYLLTLVMKPDVFDQLRTKQLLGYIASMRFVCFHNVRFCQIYVQSCDFDPVVMTERVEKFLVDYYDMLDKKLSEEGYLDELIEVMRKKYEEKPKRLMEESRRYYSEMISRTYRFGRNDEYARKLVVGEDEKYVTKEDVLEFFKKYFLSDERVVFLVQIFKKEYAEKMREMQETKQYFSDERYSEDINFLKKMNPNLDDEEGWFKSFVQF